MTQNQTQQNNQTQKTFNLREMCKLVADGTDPSDIEWTWGCQHTWEPLNDQYTNPFEAQNTLFRLKQKMIMVNGFEIPAPMGEEPKNGQLYFVATTSLEEFYVPNSWDGFASELLWFKRGLCHSTKDGAIMHAKAMLGINPFED
jgi:hypothetical protein